MTPNHDTTPVIDLETDYIFSDLNSYYKPYSEMSSDDYKVSKFVGRLNKILALDENWDGFNSARVGENVILNSMAFLGSIPAHLISRIEEDNIYPTPYGTILIEIENEVEELSIEVGANELSYYFERDEVLTNDSSIDLNNVKISPDTFTEVIELLETVS